MTTDLLDTAAAGSGSPTVGALLRTWRERRRYSQQELSDLAEVSTRHLSRVETGRAHPTAGMIVHLVERLDVPLQERNRILLAGGYAPRYREHPLDDGSIAVVMAGLRDLLDAHLPYPALLLDTYWDIVDANSAVQALLTGCDPALLEPPVNVVRLCLHPVGLGARIRNLDRWAAHLQGQVTHRAERTHDPRHRALAAEIGDWLGASRGRAARAPETVVTGPVLTLEIDLDGTVARFFSASAQLDTAADVTLDGLHLETFLPADATTRGLLGR